MKEIKIKVSPMVWVYMLLAMIAVFAVIMGASVAIGGPGAIGANKYYMITIFVCIAAFNIVPRIANSAQRQHFRVTPMRSM